MSPKKPNILLIMADQVAGPALAFERQGPQSAAKTPHLSALAETGVVFDNAYCNSPLCATSRFSFMAGQLPSRIGAYDNAAEFAASVPTLAHYLRAVGYRTILCGKMHFVGPDQLHGFEERLTTDIYPSDFGWTPDWDRPAERLSWYHNMLSVLQAGQCATSNQLDFDEEVAFHATRKLLELVRDGDERPFFLLVSFTHPHDPYAITPETIWILMSSSGARAFPRPRARRPGRPTRRLGLAIDGQNERPLARRSHAAAPPGEGRPPYGRSHLLIIPVSGTPACLPLTGAPQVRD